MASGNYDLGVSVEVKIPASTERRIRKTLNDIPPKLKAQLSRDLRTSLTPVAQEVARTAQNNARGRTSAAPLSGMTERWGNMSGKVATYPSAKPGRAIAVIRVEGDDARFRRILAITERAGTRTSGYTRVGKVMTNRLQKRFPLAGRGGRFIWKAWLRHRPEAVQLAIEAIEKFVEKTNRGA